MFMGSFPFGGMLGSCRREGLCMLTLIAEMGKLIMLIKQGETSLNKLSCLRFFINIEWVLLCIKLFCLFWPTISI